MTTLHLPLTAGSALKNAKRAWVVGTHLYTFWFLLIGVPAVATSLGAALLAIFHRCSCEIFWVALYTLMASVFVFVVIAFQFERAALLGDGSDRPNIYELEDRLFRELKFPRRVRVQWDVLGLFGIAAIILAAGQVVHAFDGLPHHPKFQYSPLVGAVPWMVLGALFLIFSLRRPWGWRAADSA